MASAAAASPSTPIRKKRNYKALQLNVETAPAPPPPEPVPTRLAPSVAPNLTAGGAAPAAPGGGGKRRPPPMALKAPKVSSTTGKVSAAPIEGDNNSAGGIAALSSTPGSGSQYNAKRNTYHTALSNKLAALDMKDEIKFELRNEDLKDLQELGAGNGGSVKKVQHVPTQTIMAKKIILIDAKPAVRKQILRELQILHDCRSKYIISFFGAFIADPNICICIEFMDKGSLDSIYKKIGPIDIEIVAHVALAVLEGLTYLYDVHRIIHRDIKPCNILLNSGGEIKICDFGVSGELINSIADTFVGTSTYMSPERIQGAAYTVKSDVWSLGISLIELALGRFPFSESDDGSDSDLSDFEGTLSPARPGPLPPARVRTKEEKAAEKRKKDKRKSKGVSLQGGGMTMSILELLQHIVNEPAPRLTPEGRFSAEAEEFVDNCLLKDPDARKTPKELLDFAWIHQARESTVDLEGWANSF